MQESTQQRQDSGSGTGHIQAVALTPDQRVDAAYGAWIAHLNGDEDTPYCVACRTNGQDCETAAGIRREWREAKRAARSI